MFTNWKTTLAGIITAIGVGFSQATDPTLQFIGKILLLVGPLLLGAMAKDHNVTGGTKEQ
jgi:hypothetical protein